MSKTAKQILEEARALIADPQHWTRGCMARGMDGEEVGLTGNYAVCWCSLGAINRVGVITLPDGSLQYDAAFHQAYGRLSAVIGDSSIADFNDTHSHAEVLAVFDKALQL